MRERPPLPAHKALTWLKRAREHLVVANDYREKPDMNFIRALNAHDAVETAVKAVMIAHGKGYPNEHDIGTLLDRAEECGATLSEEKRRAAEGLTAYGGTGQYTRLEEQEEAEGGEVPEIEKVVEGANNAVEWADEQVQSALGLPKQHKEVKAHGDSEIGTAARPGSANGKKSPRRTTGRDDRT